MGKVRIRFFSIIRDFVGKEIIEEYIRDGETLHDLLNLLEQKYPGLKELENNSNNIDVIILINGAIARDRNTIINDGDEIALVPPSSGG